jgi:1-acyl-sn-glycerol-3-phosphate acyltransferase
VTRAGSDAGMRPPWWARPTAAVLFGAGGVWPVRVHGSQDVPRTGPVLFASNHVGLLDGPMLVGSAPRWVQCLVKEEMFGLVLGPILRATGQIPVRRDHGDRAALGRALEVMASGGCVGVFPEGTRGRGDVGSVRLGVAWLALRSGAPVVPVACLGTRRSGRGTSTPRRPRARLDLVFGAPQTVVPTPAVPGRQALAHAGAALQARLSAHVRAAIEITGQVLPDDPGAPTDPGDRPDPDGAEFSRGASL